MLSDADGNRVSLADYAGRKVVVYFYPAASTPGCTKEACDFRDNLADLNDAGFAVVGSPRLAVQARQVPRRGVADVPSAVRPGPIRPVGLRCVGRKAMYGKTVAGVIRSTFVVDENGKIAEALYNVRATGHVAKLRHDLAV